MGDNSANNSNTEENAESATEAFIRREAVTEFDAIHPRFQEPQDEEALREYQIRNHFYCGFCKLFFAPTYVGLKTHFSGDMVQHPPCGSCLYCHGTVYEYSSNRQVRLYHNCRDSKP